MRQLPHRSSLLLYLDDLEYTEAALAADPDTIALAPAFGAAIDEWGEMFKAERASRRDVTRAEAVVAVRNGQLDERTMALSRRARVDDSGFFGRAFKVPPSRFVGIGLRKQCEQTKAVILPELDKLGVEHPLTPSRAPLSAAVDAALAALDDRNLRKGARQATANDVEEWKEGVNKLRRLTHADLVKIAVDKGHGRGWVETFFRSESTEHAADDDEGAQPPADVPPAVAAPDSAA